MQRYTANVCRYRYLRRPLSSVSKGGVSIPAGNEASLPQFPCSTGMPAGGGSPSSKPAAGARAGIGRLLPKRRIILRETRCTLPPNEDARADGADRRHGQAVLTGGTGKWCRQATWAGGAGRRHRQMDCRSVSAHECIDQRRRLFALRGADEPSVGPAAKNPYAARPLPSSVFRV